MRLFVASSLLLSLLLPTIVRGGTATMSLELTSPAFAAGAEIPARFTCEGEDRSPPLSWRGVPAGARSLVLIVDDPDAPDPAAPKMTWVHWVLYDLPADSTGLAEAVAASALPRGTGQGLNDWKRTGYGGPCPPIGRHRYFHKLYALDRTLAGVVGGGGGGSGGGGAHPTKAQVEAAMRGHVLASAELVGTYQKKARR